MKYPAAAGFLALMLAASASAQSRHLPPEDIFCRPASHEHDAMTAAPFSHSVVFEDDHVRVLEVLVVDDEDAVRTLIGRILEASGHRVTQAASAEMAIATAKSAAALIIIAKSADHRGSISPSSPASAARKGSSSAAASAAISGVMAQSPRMRESLSRSCRTAARSSGASTRAMSSATTTTSRRRAFREASIVR